jgi:hypothetical protein
MGSRRGCLLISKFLKFFLSKMGFRNKSCESRNIGFHKKPLTGFPAAEGTTKEQRYLKRMVQSKFLFILAAVTPSCNLFSIAIFWQI